MAVFSWPIGLTTPNNNKTNISRQKHFWWTVAEKTFLKKNYLFWVKPVFEPFQVPATLCRANWPGKCWSGYSDFLLSGEKTPPHCAVMWEFITQLPPPPLHTEQALKSYTVRIAQQDTLWYRKMTMISCVWNLPLGGHQQILFWSSLIVQLCHISTFSLLFKSFPLGIHGAS